MLKFENMNSNDVLDFSETINSILKINSSTRNKFLPSQDPIERQTSSSPRCDFEKKVNGPTEMKDFEIVDLTCDNDVPVIPKVTPPNVLSPITKVLQPMFSVHNDHQYECNTIPKECRENGYHSQQTADHEAYSLNLEPEVIIRVEGDNLPNSEFSNNTIDSKHSQHSPNTSTIINNTVKFNGYRKLLSYTLHQKKKKDKNRDNLSISDKSKFIVKKTGLPVKIHSNEIDTVNNVLSQNNYIIRKTGRKKESTKKFNKPTLKSDGIEVVNLFSDEDERSCSESITNSENDWKKESEHESDSETVQINNIIDQSNDKDLCSTNEKNYISLSMKMKSNWMLNTNSQPSYDKLLSHQKLPDITNISFKNLFEWMISKKLFYLKSLSHVPKHTILTNSIFDVSKPPKVVLELISHWVLQSDTKMVLQKLNLDQAFLKGFYQCLRAICTLSLTYKRFASNKDIVELGVTALQIHVRNDKRHVINIFGAYNATKKLFRYFLLSNNNKKGMKTVIEAWVEKSCTLFVDDQINKVALKGAGYNVFSERNNGSKNFHIKNSLERKLLALFQGKIHRMDNSLVQQFLDELAWRDEFGKSYDELLKSMLDCIQFQTRKCANKNFLGFLNYVAKSPQEFLIQPNYTIKESSKTQNNEDNRNSYIGLKSSLSSSSSSSVTSSNVEQKKLQTVKQLLLKEKAYQPLQTRSATLNSIENAKCMEKIYFGYRFGRRHDVFSKTSQHFSCDQCRKSFFNNIEFLDHLNGHVFNSNDVNELILCRYCLQKFHNVNNLKNHIDIEHPLAIVNFEEDTFSCPICETMYSTMQEIRAHLNEIHPPYDLPYKCHVCSFLCYSHRLAVDHFYFEHKGFALIQCPLCLHCVSFKKECGPCHQEEAQSYINHIKSHLTQKNFKCKKCVLIFSSTDECTKHLESSHIQNEKDVIQFNNFQNYVIQNLLCFECHDSLFLNAGHLKIKSICGKCDYTTNCQKAFSIHKCIENNYSFELDREMICLCGFKSIDGFELTKHLVNCKYKTVYGSVSEAEFMKSSGAFLISLGLERIS